ncbi:putative Transmembrane protein [Quillaja saponaria]|uniref:Transmembrane protein n=1 Tax=Quillaja saponaria TaxID=32244 RepID=A0AAD7QB83_QUISA|nr:putative Transmembrane protein [Quillaja saponaria]
MEEPDEDWNTQYSSEADGGKVSWMLNKGMRLGKQILVTGFVISAAPVVLPPLLVISAIGFACSVPSGVFLASHTCTEKLLSKLLPIPRSPRPLLDYGTVSDVEEEEERGEPEEVDFKGGINMEKEKEELQEETKRGIEMRIEMIDNGNDYNEENNVVSGSDYGQGVMQKDELEQLEDSNNVVDENGHEDPDGSYMGQKEGASLTGPCDEKLERLTEDEMEEPLIEETLGEQPAIGEHGVVITIEGIDKIVDMVEEFETPFEVTSVALDKFSNEDRVSNIEEEDLVRETKGLLERIRDEGNATDGIKENLGGANNGDQKIGSNVENIEIPSEEKDACTMGAMEREAKIEIPSEEKDACTMGAMEREARVLKKYPDSKYVENMDTVQIEVESTEYVTVISGGNDNNIVDTEKPLVETLGILNVEGDASEKIPSGGLLEGRQGVDILIAERQVDVKSKTTNEQGNIEEEQKPLVDGPTALGEERAENHIAGGVISSAYADTREIADESGFYLFEEKHVDGQEYSHRIYVMHEEPSNYMSDEYTDTVELPVSSVVHEFTHTEFYSGKDNSVSSNEVMLSEEKIWDQIEAVRTIVGYKGGGHDSCIEELKALYIFTGVEPPASFKDTSDLVEVNIKLSFLMSIVGVK